MFGLDFWVSLNWSFTGWPRTKGGNWNGKANEGIFTMVWSFFFSCSSEGRRNLKERERDGAQVSVLGALPFSFY